MIHSIFQRLSILSVVVMGVAILQAQPAEAINLTYLMGSESGGGTHGLDPSSSWIYFGGCEDNFNRSCFTTEPASPWANSYFLVGDFESTQGVYQLSGPHTGDDKIRGKVVLTYYYKFETDEAADTDTIDQGIVKLKNVDTEEIYYLETFTPADGEVTEWTKVRVPLTRSIANSRLQLVIEAVNDDTNLTTLAVDAVTFKAVHPPSVGGRVTYKEAGRTVSAAGALVALQNKKRTKTYEYTTTDENGYYNFYPVKRKRKYVVASTLDDMSGLKRLKKKTKRGYAKTANITIR